MDLWTVRGKWNVVDTAGETGVEPHRGGYRAVKTMKGVSGLRRAG